MLCTCVKVGPVVELDGSARRLQRRRRHIHRAVHVVVGEVDVERRRRCLDQPALPHAWLPTVANENVWASVCQPPKPQPQTTFKSAGTQRGLGTSEPPA